MRKGFLKGKGNVEREMNKRRDPFQNLSSLGNRPQVSNYLPAGAAGAGAGAGAGSGAGAGAGAGAGSGAGAGAGVGAGASSFFWQPIASVRERTIISVSIIAINFFIILKHLLSSSNFN